MPPIRYLPMTDLLELESVVAMMKGLYAEDPPSHSVDPERFPLTVGELVANPQRGQIVLFRSPQRICGYGILIPHWSNEFGGVIVYIDELYVLPAMRGKGLARRWLESLQRERPFDAVAFLLEVSPENARAQALYRSAGFVSRSYQTLWLKTPDPPAALR